MKYQQEQFPFTAVIGQDQFKTALILSVIDPSIGGVLAIGDKGAGKTTLIRSLAQLLTFDERTFPFVNLPIGASEDRLLGHVNLEELINSKKEQVQPGLLAKSHGGILYIDEINLLNDYLMDVLLDASASGSYYLEREGVSKHFESKFILIGSMNPEEGSLRPQLLDRFGLSVRITTSQSLEERMQVIENRMQYERDPKSFIETQEEDLQEIRKRILLAKQSLNDVIVSKENLRDSVSIALENQVEGMRADVLLIKTSRAYVAFHGRNIISSQYLTMDKLSLQKRYEAIQATAQLVFLIDASGSMAKDQAISYAKGLVHKTLEKQRKTRFAIIAIHHSQAEVIQGFSTDQQHIDVSLEQLPVGGKTNLIAGIDALKKLLTKEDFSKTQLIMITDGRFNVGATKDVFQESVIVCKGQLKNIASITVVNSEQGTVKLRLAETFAKEIGASFQHLNPLVNG